MIYNAIILTRLASLTVRFAPPTPLQIALIQMGISAFERGDDYLATRNELMRLVERVNDKYPNTIQFQVRNCDCVDSVRIKSVMN